MKRLILFGIGLWALCTLPSCLKKYDFDKVKVADWNPEIAAPLVSSTLTMDDLLENSEGFLVQDPNSGQISLIYESSVSSGILNDYLVIPDQFLETEKEFPLPPLMPGDTFILTYGQDFPMNMPGGERLDSLKINANFYLHVETNLNHDGIIEVKLPFVDCDGEILSITLNHDYNGTLPVIIDQTIPLNGCVMRPFSDGTTHNIINPVYTLTLFGDNNPNTGPYHINMGENISSIDFIWAYGHLGSKEESLADTLEIDAFNSVLVGSINLDSVIMVLDVYNTFGLPIRIVPNELWAYSSVNYPYIFRVNDLADYYEINSPGLHQIGEVAYTKIYLRSGDIANAINHSPTKFYYDFTASLNPSGSSGSNFLLDTSKVDVDVSIEVPLSGSISGLVLEDTVDFDLDNIDELQSAGFHVILENTFPLDVSFQAYLMDESKTVIDSLFDGYTLVIASGAIGPEPELRVLSPGKEVTDIQVSGQRMDNLLRTKSLILRSRLQSANSDRVRLYGDAYLSVFIGANAKLNVPID